MKRVLYTMPAVMVVLFYTMLAILAGGIGGFQPKAWMSIILPVLSALLLLGGRWWGAVPGMLLGGILLGVSLQVEQTGIPMQAIVGGVIFVYYLVMGLLCFRENQKK